MAFTNDPRNPKPEDQTLDSSAGRLEWARGRFEVVQASVEFEAPESGFWGDDYSLKPVQIADTNDKDNQ
jgi:hypothetical protein